MMSKNGRDEKAVERNLGKGINGRSPRKKNLLSSPIRVTSNPTWSDKDTNSGPQWWKANVLSTPVVPWISYSPLDPRFVGSNPAGIDGFFQSVKILNVFHRKGSEAVGPVS